MTIDISTIINDTNAIVHGLGIIMITAGQMRAARALLGLDQRQLAELSGVSLPTIQRMEASEGVVRCVVDTLIKVIEALDRAGVALIADNAVSAEGGRGVRLKSPGSATTAPAEREAK